MYPRYSLRISSKKWDLTQILHCTVASVVRCVRCPSSRIGRVRDTQTRARRKLEGEVEGDTSQLPAQRLIDARDREIAVLKAQKATYNDTYWTEVGNESAHQTSGKDRQCQVATLKTKIAESNRQISQQVQDLLQAQKQEFDDVMAAYKKRKDDDSGTGSASAKLFKMY